MSDTNDTNFRSSQEVLFSSQTFNDLCVDDCQPSTQEINNIHTQEASNASDFFDNLRESQLNVSDSSALHSNENQIKMDLTDVSIDSINDSVNDYPFTEKKKRGRKRKIRTPQELEVHLKEKKEKNRLAAQRLRQKKGTEVAQYDKEVVQLEANVNAKRQFVDLIESNVNQLRNKIKVMFGKKVNTNLINGNSTKDTDSSKNVSLNNNIGDKKVEQKPKQSKKK